MADVAIAPTNESPDATPHYETISVTTTNGGGEGKSMGCIGKKQSARNFAPVTPSSNMVLSKKWDDRNRKLHRQRLKNAHTDIDNKAPLTYKHLQVKLKKLQLEEERMGHIERENRILLERMAHVMRQTGTLADARAYRPKALNKVKRQRELLRISQENEAILKRIQSKQPHYNHLEWQEEWNAHKQYLNNISTFQRKLEASQHVGSPTADRNNNGKSTLPNIPKPKADWNSNVQLTRDDDRALKLRSTSVERRSSSPRKTEVTKLPVTVTTRSSTAPQKAADASNDD